MNDKVNKNIRSVNVANGNFIDWQPMHGCIHLWLPIGGNGFM